MKYLLKLVPTFLFLSDQIAPCIFFIYSIYLPILIMAIKQKTSFREESHHCLQGCLTCSYLEKSLFSVKLLVRLQMITYNTASVLDVTLLSQCSASFCIISLHVYLKECQSFYIHTACQLYSCNERLFKYFPAITADQKCCSF